MSTPQLSMISLDLDRSILARFGRSMGLPLQTADEGYLAHCAMRAAFGALAPQPFAMRPVRGRFVRVLGYADASADALRDRAASFAEPIAHLACNVPSMAVKAMPGAWPAGMQLGFEVRVCPIRRPSANASRKAAGATRDHAEVDCFLSECWKAGEAVHLSREEIYRAWLAREVARYGAATMSAAQMISFRRIRLSRSDHAATRRLRACERPDALMRGILEVKDPVAFAALLRRGVGRHRAFGFGMLLLRPAGNGNA
jgi:CRISPR system Cascade subunit CasE